MVETINDINKLIPGTVLSNNDVTRIFKCSDQGGMRRSHKTNSLVLISTVDRSLYHNHWIDKSTIHYTGMGQEGDQDLMWSQNKTLLQSTTNGVNVYLLESSKPRQYTYQGKVELFQNPFQEIQKDSKGRERKVWVFPLRLVDNQVQPPIDVEIINEIFEREEEAARKLSSPELERKASEFESHKPGIRSATSTYYERNAYVSEYAKRRADGKCQLCYDEAPFTTKKGEPYLETHHIIFLSKGGTDTRDNVVALCPNCHRKMHSLNEKEDVKTLKTRIGA